MRRRALLALPVLSACAVRPLPARVILVEARVLDNDAAQVEQQFAKRVESLAMAWPGAWRTAGWYTHQAWGLELALERAATEADAAAFEAALQRVLAQNALRCESLRVELGPPKRLLRR